MINGKKLPVTPLDMFNLPFRKWLLFKVTIFFFRLTGLWKHPVKRTGDFEKMTFLDIAYWIHKVTHPMKTAQCGSGIEHFFEKQKYQELSIPHNFQIKSELSISSVGDLITHSYLENSKNILYNDVSELIFNVDIAMGNLECPILTGNGIPLGFSTDAAPVLSYDHKTFSVILGNDKKKYDFLATACNHSLDFGIEAVNSTVSTLKKEGIAFNGLNLNKDDVRRTAILEKNGFKIGVVAYTFGLNAHKPPKDKPYLVNTMHLNDGVAANNFMQLTSQIKYCHENNVQFIIAHLHWGLEHEFYPTPEQIDLAHHLAEMGIDAIVGHHPHVIQPMELYLTARDPLRVVPIYYSLGNLVNSFSAPYLCLSGVMRVTLMKGVLDNGVERVYVKSASQEKVRQYVNETNQTIQLVLV